uniref:Cyclin-like domain-containing protein n=2 Tax=Timema TaxID=61471 RepID=A0A7R9ASK0_TIMSH|nr:unnamed protein product [Timema shepardi]CAD7570605.1 unnamed protein product [Timema californicum]
MDKEKEVSSEVTTNKVKTYGKTVLTLENCLLPKERILSSPSQVDGLDQETETDLRILGCELIQTAGILLKLPQVAMATGQIMFQRFFYSKSFVRHSMEITAMGCMYLASKIEESPRRLRDVINVFHHIKEVKAQKIIQAIILDQSYLSLKSQVIKAERQVLKELGFCVHVKHPHKIIVMYLQVLGLLNHQTLMQNAWNYMNDSLRTDVFVRYHPETIACACIYLTSRNLSICLPKKPAWYTIFGASEDELKDICCRIQGLYVRAKPDQEQLARQVELLRRRYDELRLKALNSTAKARSAPEPDKDGGGSEKSRPRKRSESPRHRDRPRYHKRARSDRRRRTSKKSSAHNARDSPRRTISSKRR